jgi:hypothetical protein
MIVINDLSLGKPNYDRSFILLATIITIINYDRKTFIVQATGLIHLSGNFNWTLMTRIERDEK